jgi:hypothetical protein
MFRAEIEARKQDFTQFYDNAKMLIQEQHAESAEVFN